MTRKVLSDRMLAMNVGSGPHRRTNHPGKRSQDMMLPRDIIGFLNVKENGNDVMLSCKGLVNKMVNPG